MNGVLSPINGRPLGAQWHSDLEACLRKCYTGRDDKDQITVRTVHRMPPGPLTHVGDPRDPRGKITREQFLHHLDLLRLGAAGRSFPCKKSFYQIHEEIKILAGFKRRAQNKVLPLW